jgi:hypothetical protein
MIGAITCPHYESIDGARRCRWYISNGACSRPDEFMCVEWLKANGYRLRPEAAGGPMRLSRPRTLFGKSTNQPR